MASRGQRLQKSADVEPEAEHEEGIIDGVAHARPINEADVRELADTGREQDDDQHVVIDLRGEPVIHLDLPEPSTLHGQGGLFNPPVWKVAVKRGMDIFIGSVALVLLLPLIVITALAVAATSRGPMFFRQTRIGKGGESFAFLKFRTMVIDANDRRHGLHEQNEASGPVFKIREDPRITRVGRVLRKFSIDELPQLLHVLSGKMSLVGVRPPLPDEVDHYGDREWLRLTARPGLTCIWQTSGRSDLSFDTWVDMDVEYLENWSLLLDIELLIKTVPAVLSGRGAY
jgi:lipopolysaccharide/colanic/teichoic acid biosynthesis glycosyltransferase